MVTLYWPSNGTFGARQYLQKMKTQNKRFKMYAKQIVLDKQTLTNSLNTGLQ